MSHSTCIFLKVNLMDNLIEELVSMAAELEHESESRDTVGLSDLSLSDNHHLPSISANLRKRYDAGYIYTRCGPEVLLVLHSVNDDAKVHAAQTLAIFSEADHCQSSRAPHLYQLCSAAHVKAYDQNRDQAILFHGQNSNDCFNKALEYFDSRCDSAKLPLKLLDILQICSVLSSVSTESLNSVSKMGLCLDLSLDFKGDITHVSSSHFALDRCCLVSQCSEENESFRSSFHIFYALLNGASVNLLKSLKLHRNLNSYNLLRIPNNCSNFLLDPGWAKQTFAKIENVLAGCGLSSCAVQCVWRVMAAILKLANLRFDVQLQVDGSLANHLLNPRELDEVGGLLGIDAQVLDSTIISPSTGSTASLPINPHDSRLTCGNAETRVLVLCRVLYSRLFHVLFSSLNSCMNSNNSPTRTQNIALIVGPAIPSPKTSGSHFHEFLTNYVTERLHCFYQINQFTQQQATYISEGLHWDMQDVDGCSGEVVEHMDSALVLLDQCNDAAVRAAFRKKMQQAANAGTNDHTNSACFFDADKDKFVVQHAWDKVTYNPTTFVDENLESVNSELVSALSQSKFPFIQKLFPEGSRAGFHKNKIATAHKKRLSVAMQCQLALSSILSSIKSRECSHVISLKPNDMNLPNVFDAELVQKQLKMHRISELSRLYHLGYSTSQSYVDCLQRYRMLSGSTWPVWDGPARQGVVQVTSHQRIPQSAYALGRSKIFWKSQATVLELERKRNEELHRLASLIQGLYKGWICRGGPKHRPLHQNGNRAQTIIATHFRAYVQRKKYLKMRDASTRIAACVKGWQVRRRYRCLFRSIAADKISQFLHNCLRRHYLLDLSQNLPSLSPIDCDWPTLAPALCTDVDAYLKTLYHRWRCRIYRQRIDQQGYFRMREKLAASIIFKEKKVGYYATVAHPFRGDYVRLRQNPKWRRISMDTSDEYVVFADMISKINRATGKVTGLLLVVSTSGALILDHRTLTIRYRVSITDIQRVSLSPYGDNIGVLHLTPGKGLSRKMGDFLLECRHVIELVSKLYLVVQNATACALPVDISQPLFVEGEEGTLEVVFCAPSAELEDLEQTSSCFSVSPSNLKHSTSHPEKIKRVFSPTPGACSSAGPMSPSSTPTELTPSKRTKFVKKGNVLEVHF